jgi:hypothetical protein
MRNPPTIRPQELLRHSASSPGENRHDNDDSLVGSLVRITPDAMNGCIDMAADSGVIGVSPVSRVTVAGPIAVTGPITRAIGRSVAVTGPMTIAASRIITECQRRPILGQF